MRFKINLRKENDAANNVPINNQHLLFSYIHTCLGRNNEWHGKPGDYCISGLCGGQMNPDMKTLSYLNGGYVIVASDDEKFLEAIINGLIKNKDLVAGMRFSDFELIEEKIYDGYNHFYTLSPILLKVNSLEDKRSCKTVILKARGYEKFERYHNLVIMDYPEYEETLTKYLIRKLTTINEKKDLGLDLDGFRVTVRKHDLNMIKNIHADKPNGSSVGNPSTICNLTIYSNKKVAELISNIGIGMSTAFGFGTIYKVENSKTYHFLKMKRNENTSESMKYEEHPV